MIVLCRFCFSLMNIMALCEIQWVIKFQLTAKEINHINEVIDIAIASGSTFTPPTRS
jgi:hypothetical protein